MDQIKFHVATGLLGPGDELPSTRALSAELGINPMTISKAYSYLEKEEVVERRPGRPLVVKTHDSESIKDRKIERLRENFAPTVRMVKQLGINDNEAIRIFIDMLSNAGEPPVDGERENQS
jgi:DNA-binding transcriptional regulator YhcF (GntR family)